MINSYPMARFEIVIEVHIHYRGCSTSSSTAVSRPADSNMIIGGPRILFTILFDQTLTPKKTGGYLSKVKIFVPGLYYVNETLVHVHTP
jgi:hypothetical protein